MIVSASLRTRALRATHFPSVRRRTFNMQTRLFSHRSLTALMIPSVLSFAVASGCSGDDDSNTGAGGTAAKGGKGGSAGKAASAGRGGTAGAATSGGTGGRGGSAGTSAQAGRGGTG